MDKEIKIRFFIDIKDEWDDPTRPGAGRLTGTLMMRVGKHLVRPISTWTRTIAYREYEGRQPRMMTEEEAREALIEEGSTVLAGMLSSLTPTEQEP